MKFHRKNLNKVIDLEKEGEKVNDRLIDKVQRMHTDWLDKIMILITKSGNGGLIWIIVALHIYLFEGMHQKAIVLLAVLSICAVFNNFIIKGIFTKDRPCDLDDSIPLLIKRPLGSSFPSGHTATSFACCVVIFYINPAWGIAATVWAFLIAFSRVYLYVHFPMDVIFGMISGAVIGQAGFWIVTHYIPF